MAIVGSTFGRSFTVDVNEPKPNKPNTMKLVFLSKEMNEELARERQNVALSKIKLLNHSKELIRIDIKY